MTTPLRASTGVARSAVAVVVNHPARRALLCRELSRAGFETYAVATATGALRQLAADSDVTAIVLDSRLRHGDSSLIECLRETGLIAPTLFLAQPRAGPAASQVRAVDGLLVRPYTPSEVVARVRQLSARGRVPLVAGDLVLSPHRHSVRSQISEVLLTPTEYRVLAVLMAHESGVVPRETLMNAVWPGDERVVENSLDTFVRRVRVKLRSIEARSSVTTVRGAGYRL